MQENAGPVLSTIADHLADVRSRIADAARRAGRDPNAVTLVAVSKTQPLAAIEAAYAAGQRDFGENRVEELGPKAEAAKQAGLHELRWHLIGTIQSRKTRQAIGPPALIHSVDRMKIAARLSRDALDAGRVVRVLLEVNISGEASKQGFTPQELLEGAGALLDMPGIEVQGVMTMAPLEMGGEAARPVFRGLRTLRDDLAVRYPALSWTQLSMGMTNDFEVAVEEGATLVRVGSAIFGRRA